MTKADAAVYSLDKDPGVKVTNGQFLRFGDHLQGRLLTIVEASIGDKTQLDAIKSLVKQALWGDFEQVTRWMAKQDEEKGMGNNFPF